MHVSTPSFSKLLKEAIKAAEAAGEKLLKHFQKPLKIKKKKGASLVTNADLEAQEQAIKILQKACPHFGFLAEEDHLENKQGQGRWIIDPLDGTTNYIHGFPMFCVSIAVEWDQKVVAGIIYHPILKEYYTAIQGEGAFINKKRLCVSKTKHLKKTLFSSGKQVLRTSQYLQTLSTNTYGIRKIGSAALDLAYTARGVFDGFFEKNLCPWDIAAGSLIVKEAGGKVTDLKGNPIKINTAEILATNGKLHSLLIESIY